MKALYFSDISGFDILARGKTKDIYEIDEEKLLLVFADRVAVGDIILPTPIPQKGRISAQLTKLWMKALEDIFTEVGIKHHIHDKSDEFLKSLGPHISHRSIVVIRCSPLLKCIVIPDREAVPELQEYLYIPKKQMEKGIDRDDDSPFLFFFYPDGDEEVEFSKVKRELGGKVAEKIKEMCFSVVNFIRRHLGASGLRIQMFEVEFGERNGQIYVIDSFLTPDCAMYSVGSSKAKFGKWFIHEYLKTLRWDMKSYPAPEIPDELVKEAKRRYTEIFERLSSSPVFKLES